MTEDASWPSSAELARQLQGTMGRFESLAGKLEAQFVNKDLFQLHMDGLRREIEHLSKTAQQDLAAEKERNGHLERRISKLEGNITWVVRIVLAAVVVAVLAAVGISKAGGGG